MKITLNDFDTRTGSDKEKTVTISDMSLEELDIIQNSMRIQETMIMGLTQYESVEDYKNQNEKSVKMLEQLTRFLANNVRIKKGE